MPRHRRTPNQAIEFDDDDDCCRHGDKIGQRNAANARERARMRILSKAFSRLKTTLPWVPADTKLSKLDTLRLATSYIAHLRTILTDDETPPPIVHPLNLTWPFTLQSSPSDQSPRDTDDWSSSDHHCNNKTSFTANSTPGRKRSTPPPSEHDADDSRRHFQSRNIHFSDRKHNYSDSLLNIG